MLDAHAEAGYVVGTPFATEGVYDFAQHGALTRRVSDLGVAQPFPVTLPCMQAALELHHQGLRRFAVSLPIQ